MEDLQTQHRKELRDLQSRITQKKKQASKKTRKGVNDECDRLELEIRQRHEAEIAALNGQDVDSQALPTAQLDELTLKVNSEEEQNGSTANGSKGTISQSTLHAEKSESIPDGKKPNRQKARLARRAAEQEEIARQAAEEAKNLPDMKEQERSRMKDALKQHGLIEKEIRADGHCLYSALADQLEQLEIPIGSAPGGEALVGYKLVRAKAAEYIQQHEDDFVPFLEEPLSDYVYKVKNTGEWGGQLELMALAKTYAVDINVLQDFGRVEKIEGGNGDTAGKIAWLGYYKHGFGLGEHYNSLRKAA